MRTVSVASDLFDFSNHFISFLIISLVTLLFLLPDTFNFLNVVDKYPAYPRWGPWRPGQDRFFHKLWILAQWSGQIKNEGRYYCDCPAYPAGMVVPRSWSTTTSDWLGGAQGSASWKGRGSQRSTQTEGWRHPKQETESRELLGNGESHKRREIYAIKGGSKKR